MRVRSSFRFSNPQFHGWRCSVSFPLGQSQGSHEKPGTSAGRHKLRRSSLIGLSSRWVQALRNGRSVRLASTHCSQCHQGSSQAHTDHFPSGLSLNLWGESEVKPLRNGDEHSRCSNSVHTSVNCLLWHFQPQAKSLRLLRFGDK